MKVSIKNNVLTLNSTDKSEMCAIPLDYENLAQSIYDFIDTVEFDRPRQKDRAKGRVEGLTLVMTKLSKQVEAVRDIRDNYNQ